MSGFFAEGRFWDVSDTDDALISTASDRLGWAGALGEVRRLWAVADGDIAAFRRLVDRRAAREPFSHLVGYRDFYKHRFHVTSDVLDPRPDTETLVIEALKVPFETVLDLGTGSGCILLSLLAENQNATGFGTDKSDAALAVAARNAHHLALEQRATFIRSDWYAEIADRFDLIVSNPPYIAVDEMAALQPEVRDYEPRLALTDEGDGLSCYREITAGAAQYLTNDGYLMVEVGPTQAQAVDAMFAAQGFANIRVIQDLDGRNRVVLGQKLTR